MKLHTLRDVILLHIPVHVKNYGAQATVMAVVVVVNSGAHPRNRSGIYLKNNLRDNSKPRKEKNVYPKRGGKGSSTKKS